jgi:hypothetical protein
MRMKNPVFLEIRTIGDKVRKKSVAVNLGCGIPPKLAAFYLQYLLEIQFIFF